MKLLNHEILLLFNQFRHCGKTEKCPYMFLAQYTHNTELQSEILFRKNQNNMHITKQYLNKWEHQQLCEWNSEKHLEKYDFILCTVYRIGLLFIVLKVGLD